MDSPEGIALTGQSPSRVLHDVTVRGRFALGRPRGSSPVVVAPDVASLRAQLMSQENPAPAVQPEAEACRRGYEEGFAKGLLEGRAKGAEEARAQTVQAAEQAERGRAAQHEELVEALKQETKSAAEARLAQLNSLIAALPSQIETRLEAAEDDMLALCFEVVCRLLGESATRPDVLGAHLRHAVAALRNRPLVAIHLHAEDLALLEKAGVIAGMSGEPAFQWVASSDVPLGGCVLESPEGGLDARFDTQLQALRETLNRGRAVARSSSPAKLGAGD